MRVLVACECSSRVRDAFLRRGHDAYSCDLRRADHPNPNWRRHIRGDVRPLLRQRWDIIIAHPPCTYLSNVSACNWIGGVGGEGQPVASLIREAAVFFLECLNANADRVCVENPRQHSYAQRLIGVPHTQEVQPYQFGDPYRKATRLWLQNLPALEPTNVVSPTANWVDSGKRNCNGRSGVVRNPKLRAMTFEGIASAMAEQWG